MGTCAATGSAIAVSSIKRLKNVCFIASILPKTKMYEKPEPLRDFCYFQFDRAAERPPPRTGVFVSWIFLFVCFVRFVDCFIRPNH